MNLRIQIVFLFFFIALVTIACGSKKSDRLPGHEKKFARVYAELALLRERIPITDTAYEDSSRALLRKFNYTPGDFKKSVAWFSETPERWVAFYKEVQSIIHANKSSAAARR